MTNVGYVAVGYSLTIAALAGYVVSLIRRTRRARRRLQDGDERR